MGGQEGGLDLQVTAASALREAGRFEGLEAFGIKLNKEENSTRKPGARIITTPDSKIPVIIIPTNEELQIALATVEVLKK